ncbi:TonB-dependent receptor [Chitiniphilus eburneus]|uniref:TonB-dependent receptor n=1 Tax=Chitiniphilus eburneus TaxID=2571148 RepID=A0A4U0Q8F1_9NEIS|nr:TonB-dependent receptor [Chitiniphilus eburneus]TJZ72044.1 TonB-dependent receptor [Chitiniphilus eburneus]
MSYHRHGRPLRARLLNPLATAVSLVCAPAALAEEKIITLPITVVTANPFGNADLATPVSQLTGDALRLRDATTLGEVLTGLPGVASTSFGPGASRPVIRGLDGDRIRILQNGVGALDASALSYDHAVPQDVASVESIEVVRGPAALLYGGSAIGGVVNALDYRIPRGRLDGVEGAANVEYGGAASERVAGARLDAGNGDYAIHLDGFNRRSKDLRIPGDAWSERQRAGLGSYQPPEHGHDHGHEEHGHEEHAESAHGTLPNSDSRAYGGAAGISRTWDDGYLGVAYSSYRSNYGSVAEEDVRLDLKQDRLALAFARQGLGGAIDEVKADLAYTDYRHQELHGSEVGTTFKNRGYEGRIELRHAPVGQLDGLIGMQFGQSRFSALGEEAFVPDTDTDQAALFLLEQWTFANTAQLSLGGRVEYSKLSPDSGDNRRFRDSDARSFTAGSLSAGLTYPLAGGWSLAGNLAYTERAPTYYELYANGQHVATGTFERGDPDAKKERATSLDAALRYQSGATHWSFGGYYSRFANFIALERTARWCHAHGDHDHCGRVQHDGESPEYQYRGVPANVYGLELDSNWRLYQHAARSIDLLLWGDITRAEQRQSGEPLPRIPPMRIAGAVVYGQGPLSLRAELQHAADQDRVPANDTPTDGYTVANVSASYRFSTGGGTEWLAYLRGDNLGNEEIRYASSLTRDIAPQGKRSVRAGVTVAF